MAKFNSKDFREDGSRKFKIRNADTKLKDVYADDNDYAQMLLEQTQELDQLQNMMYAHNRYSLLVIFQAIDAAGKDGTIRHVFSGINPAGLTVQTFKRPSDLELDHDYLWRSNMLLPQRGCITVFNRSYYEEVLVVKIHPEILESSQRIPDEFVQNLDNVWKNRYEDISNLETYLHRNGTKVVKFFLNISKKEQGKRLIERIEDQSKNWKFEDGDLKERELWDEYLNAFEDCINHTASPDSPWYVIPADDKKNMRLFVSRILIEEMKKLKMSYPATDAEREEQLKTFIEVIKSQS